MKNIYSILILSLFVFGCSAKMAYLNTRKPPQEIEKDKADCQAMVDASDFKGADLKRKEFDQCMKDKGYKVVSEDEAEKIQGFAGLWIKPEVDFKAYEAIFVDAVDVSRLKIDNAHVPEAKVTDEEINNLAEEMQRRFSEALAAVMPVIPDKEKLMGKKALYLSLRLDKVAPAASGVNAALQVVGHFSPVPLPSAPQGAFSFQGEITEYPAQEKLLVVSDECEKDKNASLAGVENYEKWKHAYNIMDYWADHLAALLAKQRGQKYKSQLGLKLI